MTFRYPFIPGKRAFGTFNNRLSAGDYTSIKKNGRLGLVRKCGVCLDPTDLDIGLIKKTDLQNVNVLQTLYPLSSPQAPTTINPANVFYLTYAIDPDGELFGNSPCGLNNYPRYMVYATKK